MGLCAPSLWSNRIHLTRADGYFRRFPFRYHFLPFKWLKHVSIMPCDHNISYSVSIWYTSILVPTQLRWLWLIWKWFNQCVDKSTTLYTYFWRNKYQYFASSSTHYVFIPRTTPEIYKYIRLQSPRCCIRYQAVLDHVKRLRLKRCQNPTNVFMVIQVYHLVKHIKYYE